MKAGVPTLSFRSFPCCMRAAMPKSASLTFTSTLVARATIIAFWGLMSLWQIFFECRNLTPSSICHII